MRLGATIPMPEPSEGPRFSIEINRGFSLWDLNLWVANSNWFSWKSPEKIPMKNWETKMGIKWSFW